MNAWDAWFSSDFLDAAHRDPAIASGPAGAVGRFLAEPAEAARWQFRHSWPSLDRLAGDALRVVFAYDRDLGPIAFFGLLVGERSVELLGFIPDHYYVDDLRGEIGS